MLRLVLLRPGEHNARYKLLPHRGLEMRFVEAADSEEPMIAFGAIDEKGAGSVFYVTNIEQVAPHNRGESEVMFTCDDIVRRAKALIISSS